MTATCLVFQRMCRGSLPSLNNIQLSFAPVSKQNLNNKYKGSLHQCLQLDVKCGKIKNAGLENLPLCTFTSPWETKIMTLVSFVRVCPSKWNQPESICETEEHRTMTRSVCCDSGRTMQYVLRVNMSYGDWLEPLWSTWGLNSTSASLITSGAWKDSYAPTPQDGVGLLICKHFSHCKRGRAEHKGWSGLRGAGRLLDRKPHQTSPTGKATDQRAKPPLTLLLNGSVAGGRHLERQICFSA